MADTPEKPRSHTLEDHLLGMDPMHSHEDGEADHDHDHDDLGGEYDPTTSSLWAQDNITLLSVGIDIGSAGTQVVFSRVQLRRLSEQLTSRYFVVNRETLLAARKDPEKYRNLIVRIAGYSAYFVDLSPAQQAEIIARTEEALA